MFRAIITMMDVPTALGQLAPRVRQLSRGGALLVFACLLLILGPLTYLWWRFDLSSTWFWFAGLIGDGSAAKAEVGAAATRAGADAATAQLILLLFGMGFTLLPSAVVQSATILCAAGLLLAAAALVAPGASPRAARALEG